MVPLFRIVVPLTLRAQPRQSADGPEKEYSPRSDIRTQKSRYDMPCWLSRPHLPKKIQFLWAGNRQDSCK
jgi:hypothetical protein